jgi:hypothetical protein
MFQRLVAYKKQYKSTNVSHKYTEDPQLGQWVNNQRQSHKKKELSVDRTSLLDSIAFVWEIYEVLPWKEMYQRLVAYKNHNKTTNVPYKYKADPKLGLWVNHQRDFYSKKTLSVDRINLLESVGFVWNTLDTQWMEIYNKLVEYKNKHGSTLVPTIGHRLYKWVSTQRKVYNNGDLLKKRYELLSSIGFAWTAAKKTASQKRFKK